MSKKENEEKRKKELTIGEEFGILTERQTQARKTVAKSGGKIRERLKKRLDKSLAICYNNKVRVSREAALIERDLKKVLDKGLKIW